MTAPQVLDWLEVTRGNRPLVLSFPHTGLTIPKDCATGLKDPLLAIHDADWFVDRLYAFAAERDITLVRMAISRTVIDVNRDPSGASLYPGQVVTELCPTTTFDGWPLYRPGCAPDTAVIADRIDRYFTPYHRAIADELARLKARHGRIVLYDCHSIRSHVPRLFDGPLPDFNIGTFDGQSCAPELTDAVAAHCGAPFTRVVNGRFKGGWTIRHYGQPTDGIHAIQMELGQAAYLPPPTGLVPPLFDLVQATPMIERLDRIIGTLLDWAGAGDTP